MQYIINESISHSSSIVVVVVRIDIESIRIKCTHKIMNKFLYQLKTSASMSLPHRCLQTPAFDENIYTKKPSDAFSICILQLMSGDFFYSA